MATKSTQYSEDPKTPAPSGSIIPVHNTETTDFPNPVECSTHTQADIPDAPARVLQRHDWGAKEAKYTLPLNTPVKKLVVTWTETEPCLTEAECKSTVQKLQVAHMKEIGVPDIKHNFLIGGDGTLFEGRGFSTIGPRYPTRIKHSLYAESIEIAFIDKCTNKPGPLQLKALSECISFGIAGKMIDGSFETFWLTQKDIVYIQPPASGQAEKQP